MAGIIDQIRVAGRAITGTGTPAQKELLKQPLADQIGKKRSPSPMNRGANLLNRNQLAGNMDPSPFHKHRPPAPVNKDRAPLKWERTPRPDIKPLRPPIGLPRSPLEKLAEDKARHPAPVQAGRGDVTSDLMRLRLDERMTNDLPSNMPKTGRVVVRRIEQKNGKIETWEKTVWTQDGNIIKYEDVKLNST